jgi:hypothetical protein
LGSGVPKGENVEPIVCSKCGWVDVVAATPFHRRKRVDHHMFLEDEVFYSLKARCARYKSFNNGIAMMMRELDKYNIIGSTVNLINNVRVRSLDEEISRLTPSRPYDETAI